MHPLLLVFVITVGGLLAGAAFLHLLARLGSVGRRISDAFSRAPLLDVAVFYFTLLPWVVGLIIAGWWGVLISLGGQFVGMWSWIIAHELTHPNARRGPRIYSTLDSLVGRWRNHLALWFTSIAVPGFWCIRLTEIIVYPFLTWTIRLPKYNTKEWVNISRHKFSGLVGYDLIWCLYCDWMTGVWALGSEMLRNLESYWCPIRFYDNKKCENCKLDFPDIDGGWAPADGTMADVTAVLEKQYKQPRESNSWFGHTTRLTVEGEDIKKDP